MAKNNIVTTVNNAQESFPTSSAGTGTITSVNNKQKILGSGTAFETEVKIGDWIYIKGQNDFRKVINIVNDTELTIESAFGVDLSASAFDITPASRYRTVSILVDSANTATIDGVSFEASTSLTFDKANRGNSSSGSPFIDPIDIDTTTNANVVTIVAQE